MNICGTDILYLILTNCEYRFLQNKRPRMKRFENFLELLNKNVINLYACATRFESPSSDYNFTIPKLRSDVPSQQIFNKMKYSCEINKYTLLFLRQQKIIKSLFGHECFTVARRRVARNIINRITDTWRILSEIFRSSDSNVI